MMLPRVAYQTIKVANGTYFLRAADCFREVALNLAHVVKISFEDDIHIAELVDCSRYEIFPTEPKSQATLDAYAQGL